ncbi:MAG: acetyl-CoA carboxylase carboxyltransferase subunit beta [Acidobacteria bacterium]|nr:acetyl-CoA carboxylase carboxyltransferase subunit beta [Acidobacteriota bacterium]MCB9396268.1 acetyl-CoA carboxylase carboxyltransferase subunit beta [Acidobacteriota bacterium]
MTWFIKNSTPLKTSDSVTVRVPEGMWEKCPSCKEIIYRQELQRNENVCPKCDYHFRITPEARFQALFDEGKYNLLYQSVISTDPLAFKGLKKYRDQLKNLAKNNMQQDSVWVGRGKLEGIETVICVMDFQFLGGSMGSAVGEKITRAIECGTEERLPVIIFSCSGGARMMEGALSLMQMAKISAALAVLDQARVPFISVLTDPTTGGVTASFAMLGDINIAEPKALIGFAGPRVIQQTIRQELPEGFQSSEFLLQHGMLDAVVPRREMKQKLARYLTYFLNPDLFEAEPGA